MNLIRRNAALIATASLMFVCSAHAAPITVAFPSGSSSITASAGTFFFQSSHSVSESFLGTGFSTLTSLGLHLDLATNALSRGGHVDFDVLVNGTDVGDIVFTQASGTAAFDFQFSFASINGLGDYTIILDENNDVPIGLGSVSFDLQNSTATLDGSGSSVPEPATLALVGLGLLGLARSRHTKQEFSARL